MDKNKAILYGLLAVVAAVFVFLVIPMDLESNKISEMYNNLDDSEANFSSKRDFFKYVESLITARDKQDESVSGNGLSSEGGQRLADAAKAEYDYYVSNNLVGGYRYWYWFDLIKKIDSEGKSIDDYYPLGSQYTKGGWYEKSAVNNTNAAQWCDMFVSCVAQSAGFTSTQVIPPESYCQTEFNKLANANATCKILNSSYAVANMAGFKSYVGSAIVGVEFVDSCIPNPGDLIFYSWSKSGGRLAHIGIVYSVNGETVTTIEGNTGGGRVQQTKVNMKNVSLSDKNIAGYVTPNYK